MGRPLAHGLHAPRVEAHIDETCRSMNAVGPRSVEIYSSFASSSPGSSEIWARRREYCSVWRCHPDLTSFSAQREVGEA